MTARRQATAISRARARVQRERGADARARLRPFEQTRQISLDRARCGIFENSARHPLQRAVARSSHLYLRCKGEKTADGTSSRSRNSREEEIA